jgi:hypothetical protein
MFSVRFDMGQVTRRFKRLRDKVSRGEIMRSAEHTLVANLAAYIFRRSLERHKTAEKFGAKPTGILEFISGGRGTAASKGGGKIYARGNADSRSIFISGVPFIQKAFRSLFITPKKANALTIPLSKIAFGKRVKDLRASGWNIFRPVGKNVLMGKRTARSKPVVLYALVKSVTIPRDARLLPSAHLMNIWTANAVKEELAQ